MEKSVIEVNEYDFSLLKMYSSPYKRCYTIALESRELTVVERLELIYDILSKIEENK